MMIYLTGAQTSLAKTQENPQTDAAKSLGGYISSTPVPNAALNSLFDMISAYTLEKRPKETIAVGIINKFDKAVENVELKIVTDENHEAIFKVAAVSIGEDYAMEHIANRYQEPLMGEFHNATFYRAAVDSEVKQPAAEGEEIALYPFNVVISVKEGGIEGTWNAFSEAFSNDETYDVKRISEKVFRIEMRDETILDTPLECSYISTEGFTAEFLGDFKNKEANSVLLTDHLEPKQAIGLWLQRIIKKNEYKTNEQLLKEYKEKFVLDTLEEVEMIISYNFVEE
jgi:hypothetical protein